MRTFASLARALAALLPHNHGHLAQPSKRSRCYAHQAGIEQLAVTTLELELDREFVQLARQRRNACMDTAILPVFNEDLADEAREALAHNAMAGVDIEFATKPFPVQVVVRTFEEVAA